MWLIDANALLKELNNLEPRCANKYVKQGIDDGLHYYMPKILGEQPTVDAVPVVRCKDCKWYGANPYDWENEDEMFCKFWIDYLPTNADDFCSYGERRRLTAMADCKCEFVYDELYGCIRCKKCFRVLTAEEKRTLLEHANALRRAEEDEKDG